jgi:hypothetical protein
MSALVRLSARRSGTVIAAVLVLVLGQGVSSGIEVGSPSQVPPAGSALAPGWGITHTESGADDGDSRSAGAAQELLAQADLPQVQALMGWGADDPEPSPGRFDFSTLDERVRMIERSGGRPVITLCCAPDWMKGGQAGTTDWSRLETAPLPQHYADFAALAAVVARRYPQVHDFLVWNEFKGFFEDGQNQWNAAAYTDLYNQVYRSLKRVNPKIDVGGPYLPLDSYAQGAASSGTLTSGPWGGLDERSSAALDYWLAHKAGADFLVVDGSSQPEHGGSSVDEFTAVRKFTDLSIWLRGRTSLPVWWAEYYVEPSGVHWSEAHLDAVLAAGMMALARGGVSAAFYWNPETTGDGCAGCLWTSTWLPPGRGGRPMPVLGLLQGFARWFPPGTPLVPVTSGSPKVVVLAQAREVLAVNTTAAVLHVTVDSQSLALAPYEIRWFARHRARTPH